MYSDSVLRDPQQAGHHPGERYAPGQHSLPADRGPLLQ